MITVLNDRSVSGVVRGTTAPTEVLWARHDKNRQPHSNTTVPIATEVLWVCHDKNRLPPITTVTTESTLAAETSTAERNLNNVLGSSMSNEL